MNLLDVRCQKCGVTVGVLPGSAAWHCGQKMVPVDPEQAALERKVARRLVRIRRRPRPVLGGGADGA